MRQRQRDIKSDRASKNIECERERQQQRRAGMYRRPRRSLEKRRKEKRRAALKIKLKKERMSQEFNDFRVCVLIKK